MIILALCLLLICAAAVIAAQGRRLIDADDHIAALNAAITKSHREVLSLRRQVQAP